MAVVSLGKMGRLDAICARLKLTQQGSEEDGQSGNNSCDVGPKAKSTCENGGHDDGALSCDSTSTDRSYGAEGAWGNDELQNAKRSSDERSENVGSNAQGASGGGWNSPVREDIRCHTKHGLSSNNSSSNNNNNNNNSNTKDFNQPVLSQSMQLLTVAATITTTTATATTTTTCVSEQCVSSTTVESVANNESDNIEGCSHSLPQSPAPASGSCHQQYNNVDEASGCDQSPLPSNDQLVSSAQVSLTFSSSSLSSSSPPSLSSSSSSFLLSNPSTLVKSSLCQKDDQGSNIASPASSQDSSSDTKHIETCSEASGKCQNPKTSKHGMYGCKPIMVDSINKSTPGTDSPVSGECSLDKVTQEGDCTLASTKSEQSIQLTSPAMAKADVIKTPKATTVSCDVSPPVPNSAALGRRKSRKSAKPQKQVAGRYLSDAFPNYEGLDGFSEEENGMGKSDKSGPDTSRDCLAVQDSPPSSGPFRACDMSSSRSSEAPYANMLVDYAKNTMSELLGIYGFEGSDARNLSLGKMLHFPDNLPPEAGVKKAGTPSNSPIKSGPFRKRVYQSLTHPTIDNGQNGQVLKAPSPPLSSPVLTTNNNNNSNNDEDDTPTGLWPIKPKPASKPQTSRNGLETTPKRHYAVKTFTSSDFHKYIRRYASGVDCGGEHCHALGYRDHYHCLDCPTKVFIRKEEMVRHFKWHKKRQDSLQHGFMRYSPVDDCSQLFGPCTHNGRQTHYHCVQQGCDKVYISTSDVQMHANFHRKDSAIIQEGFQRFRATEDCGTVSCAFYGHRTTHFHCRRPQCHFTFKNKSDMEKHKSYHQKDEVLSRDGFKKFMKYESCQFASCRYSKVCNHIHCIRPGCYYVLHSTAQLYSHKRKHERREFEQAYKKPSMIPTLTSPPGITGQAKSTANTTPLANGKLGGHTNVPPMMALTQALQIKPDPDGPKIPAHQATKNPIGSTPIWKQPDSPLVAIPTALNLSTKKVEDGDRHTMALPVSLESTGAAVNNIHTEEAEDLSLPSKQALNCVEVKTEQDSGHGQGVEERQRALSLSMGRPSMEDDIGDVDDCDDDDDDDDDDKDYTQVEEPTLVNGYPGLMEEDVEDSCSVTSSTTTTATKEYLNAGSQESSNEEMEEEQEEVTAVPGNSLEVKGPGGSGQDSELIPGLLRTGQQVSQLRVLSTPDGQVMGIQIPPRQTHDKKEKDEGWKKYLIRYTANDACFSRCTFLYKDHYHCRAADCQVTFKFKDDIRSHARFHELQDAVTPLVYFRFDSETACKYQDCPYDQKEEHYHCNWTNCKQVIPRQSPNFALLKHYRIHEYGMLLFNKTKVKAPPQPPSVKPKPVELDPMQKRRGRPPKYPRYDCPVVPKVHLTEKEILDSTLAFMHKKYSENSIFINGFKKFEPSEICPDDKCVYQEKKHFHCGRKFCHMSTDRLDFLNLHAKDFHNRVTILDGYEFFERVVDCRRPHCHNNHINHHFHCIRPRCDYSFVRHSTMCQHNKKHPTATSAVLQAPLAPRPPRTPKTPKPVVYGSSISQYIPIAPANSKGGPVLRKITPQTSPISYIKIVNPIPTPQDDPGMNPEEVTIDDNEASNMTTVESKTVVKSAGTFFPLSGVPSKLIVPTSTSQITAEIMTKPGKSQPSNVGGGMSKNKPNSMSPSTPKSTTPISPALALQTASASPLVQQPTIVSVSLPASIPLLAQPSTVGQQPATSLLTGMVPMSHVAHPAMVSLPGTQIISSSSSPSGPFLQAAGLMGTSMVQLIHNPVSVLSSSAIATSTTQAAGSGTLVTTLGNTSSPNIAPLTILLHQPGLSSPLSWAALKKRMHYPVEANCGRPFCKLKKKGHYHCLDCNQAFSDHARLRVHIGKHGIKFRKSGHSSKAADDDDESSITFVGSQSSKVNMSLGIQPKEEKLEAGAVAREEEDKLSSSLNLQLGVFTNMVAKGREAEAEDKKSDSPCSSPNEKITLVMSNVNSKWTIGKADGRPEANGTQAGSEAKLSETLPFTTSDIDPYDSETEHPSLMIDDRLDESTEDSSLNDSSSSLTLCSSLSRKSGRKRSLIKNEDFVDSDTLVIPKLAKLCKTGKKESDLPSGYKRVRCGEDCGHIRCSYRQTVTHFHCLRPDCGYGFSDKSRIVQHTIRHQRLDTMMAGEFQQFRASVSCKQDDCEFDEKASHFHCLKCSFSCTDSSKVPPHRKHHTKLENISSNGFIKFSGTDDCQIASCSYFRKQTHYHCSFPGCNHSVLGPSQMAPHKLKHA